MRAAAVIIPSTYPGDLTAPQWGTLQAIAAMRGVGHSPDALDMRHVRALERRDLVEQRGTVTLSRVDKWFATMKGHDLIRADKRERGEGQGPLRLITPSKRSLWEGAKADGSRFTAGQVFGLDERRIDHRRASSVLVKVPVPEAELYVPLGRERPVRAYCCPVVGTCRKPPFTGRATILTPSGDLANCEWDVSDPRSFGSRTPAPYGREAWW